MEKFKVQVAFAQPTRQRVIDLEVEQGTTAEQAVEQSGIGAQFPEIDFSSVKLGVFGKAVKGNHELEAGDRVEIYRPLKADPKDSRRKRAERAQSKRDEA